MYFTDRGIEEFEIAVERFATWLATTLRSDPPVPPRRTSCGWSRHLRRAHDARRL